MRTVRGSVVADRVFIDTNVLVYADDVNGGAKRKRAIEVLSTQVSEERAVISTQILQEYFAVATRKLGLTAEDARRRVEVLRTLDIVVVKPELILRAIDLHRLHSISFWDALVVACAKAAACGTILTEDLNHGQIIDGIVISNPFVEPTRAGEPRARYIPRRSRARQGLGAPR